MRKAANFVVALLFLAPAGLAHAQASPSVNHSAATPGTVNFRFSEQISNAPPGSCNCFEMEGAAADVSWNLNRLGGGHGASLALAADVGVEHTGGANGSAYGLTLTTLTGGPRLIMPGHKLRIFGQALFGFAHGSGEFPDKNALVGSANSFALDLGGGADYALSRRFSLRLPQLDYVRTGLPNTSTNYQNNLRIGVGLTMHF